MFLLIILSFFLSGMVRNLFTSSVTLIQTDRMHQQMVHSLVRSQVAFFDSNPVGRILNRFSKDISIGDHVLPVIATWFTDQLFLIASIIVLLCIAIPFSTVPVIIVLAFVLFIRFYFLIVYRESMKLELISRSPVATALGASISGLTTIRAYRKLAFFQSKF